MTQKLEKMADGEEGWKVILGNWVEIYESSAGSRDLVMTTSEGEYILEHSRLVSGRKVEIDTIMKDT